MSKRGFFQKLCILIFAISLFFPLTISSYADTLNTPDISAKYAITMDLKTGEVIYSKDATAKAYPASITKLMTALLFAEHTNKDAQIPFTKEASNQPAYSLHSNWPGVTLKLGQSMSASDVMNALLLFSANDAAYMIADSVGGNSQNFAKMMNEKAKELGMKNTHFVTPNGLHNENHYTTAYDLAVLLKAAFSNPWVKETLESKTAQIAVGGKLVNIENRNKTLGQNGNIAGKTGTTGPAGECLATVYNRDGREILGIVLHSKYNVEDTFRYDDMNKIMDYSYNAKPEALIKANEEIQKLTINYKLFRFFGPIKSVTIPIKAKEDVMLYSNNFNKEHKSITLNSKYDNAWQVASNDNIELTLTDGPTYKAQIEGISGISTFTLLKANWLVYIGTLAVILVAIFLIFLLIKTINKRRYKKRRYSSFKMRY